MPQKVFAFGERHALENRLLRGMRYMPLLQKDRFDRHALLRGDFGANRLIIKANAALSQQGEIIQPRQHFFYAAAVAVANSLPNRENSRIRRVEIRQAFAAQIEFARIFRIVDENALPPEFLIHRQRLDAENRRDSGLRRRARERAVNRVIVIIARAQRDNAFVFGLRNRLVHARNRAEIRGKMDVQIRQRGGRARGAGQRILFRQCAEHLGNGRSCGHIFSHFQP